jgi:hypothetical protein
MSECWLPVAGHEGQYEVSDQGRVRSLARVVTVKASSYRPAYARSVPERILRPGPSNSGHLTVILGKHNTRLVHVLVLEAFVGPRPIGYEACHGLGGVSDNSLLNLRWDTRSSNNLDAVCWGKRTPEFYRENGRKIKNTRLQNNPDTYCLGSKKAWETRRSKT